MKTIFVLDQKDYTVDMPVKEKTVVRALICHEGRYAMEQSGKGYYKIPGGGVEPGESYMDTLDREVREETGLMPDLSTVRELGMTLEKRRDVFNPELVYQCLTLFYECRALPGRTHTDMTESELLLGFHPVWASLDEIIDKNRELEEMNYYWKIRDYRFLLWYREEILNRRCQGVSPAVIASDHSPS